jgi:mannitol/fructose-specific phosphotransferase system IIA component (Ntr-type)
MAAGVCERPVEFDALDGEPVELLFLLIGPRAPPART